MPGRQSQGENAGKHNETEGKAPGRVGAVGRLSLYSGLGVLKTWTRRGLPVALTRPPRPSRTSRLSGDGGHLTQHVADSSCPRPICPPSLMPAPSQVSSLFGNSTPLPRGPTLPSSLSSCDQSVASCQFPPGDHLPCLSALLLGGRLTDMLTPGASGPVPLQGRCQKGG